MRVYLHSDRAEKSKSYIVNLAPAADPGVALQGVPDDWKNPDGTAKQMQVDFVYGVAEVSDELGKYMVGRGIAHKSRLLRKISQLFDAKGEPIHEVFDASGQRINLDTPVAA
jgi:hypothetical protein